MLNGGGDQHVSIRDDINGFIRTVSIPVIKYMDRIEVEAIPKRIFANAHAYHINSISLNSDQETFMSAEDLRINLWHIEITNQSFSKYKNKQNGKQPEWDIIYLENLIFYSHKSFK